MTSRSARRVLPALAACALALASCTSSRGTKASGSPSGSSGSASGVVEHASTSAHGVTADTIKIGFTYPDLSALAKTGLLDVDNGPYEDIVKALVDDVNAHGGINGRKLQLFTAKYSVLENTAQLSACTQLTEDDQVFAVLGGFLGDNNLCVAQQHSTILVSGYGSGFNDSVLAQARAPWVTWNASDERAVQALVKLLDQQGRLKGKTIAVYGQTPQSKSLVDLTVKTLKDAGYMARDTAVIDVEASDAQAFNAQDRVVAQRFRDEHVDAMFVLGGTPTGSNWDAVGFHPAIYVPQTSLITPAAYTNPLGKFPIVAGAAASADPNAGYDVPSMQQCRAVYKKATGRTILTPTEETAQGKSSGFPAMQSTCTALQIFDSAARAAGKDLNQQTWLKGLESLGNLELPAAPVASFGPNKPDGQDSFQLEQHDPTWTPKSSKPEFIPLGSPITLRG